MILNTSMFDGKTVFRISSKSQLEFLMSVATDKNLFSDIKIDKRYLRLAIDGYSEFEYDEVHRDGMMAIRPVIDRRDQVLSFCRATVSFYICGGCRVFDFEDMLIGKYADDFSESDCDISMFL